MKIWRICLGIWFLVEGLITILSLTFNGLPIIMGVLAIFVGVLVLLDR